MWVRAHLPRFALDMRTQTNRKGGVNVWKLLSLTHTHTFKLMLCTHIPVCVRVSNSPFQQNFLCSTVRLGRNPGKQRVFTLKNG